MPYAAMAQAAHMKSGDTMRLFSSATALALVMLSGSATAQCIIETVPNVCGFAGGSMAYARNTSTTNSYRITTRMDRNGSFFRNDVNNVSAGDRAQLGCTRGEGVDYYTFTVIGCERLN